MIHKHASKTITNYVTDIDKNEYEYKCVVVVTIDRTVDSARIEWIQSYDSQGEQIASPSITMSLLDKISEHAGTLALEMISDSDFIDDGHND